MKSLRPLNLCLNLCVGFALIFTLNFVPVSVAQGTASRVTGTVTDSSGGAINGATVTLTNQETNVAFTTQTTDSGTYTFESVQVGTYSVAVEQQGFKRFISVANSINVNQPATLTRRSKRAASKKS